jgi:hypothetical protein
VRGQRHAVRGHRHAVAAVVLRTRCSAGQPVRLDVPVLLGARGRRGGLRRHVGPGGHQPDGGCAVAQRPGRAGLGQREHRVPAGGGAAGLLDRRPRQLRQRHAGLLGADQRVPGRERRDPPRRAGPARLHDVLAAGRASRRSGRVCSSPRAWRHSDRSD